MYFKNARSSTFQPPRNHCPNSIADTLNPAGPGSVALAQLATLTSLGAWLTPFRFVGMAFLFFGITIALTVIIGTLRMQAGLLINFYNEAVKR